MADYNYYKTLPIKCSPPTISGSPACRKGQKPRVRAGNDHFCTFISFEMRKGGELGSKYTTKNSFYSNTTNLLKNHKNFFQRYLTTNLEDAGGNDSDACDSGWRDQDKSVVTRVAQTQEIVPGSASQCFDWQGDCSLDGGHCTYDCDTCIGPDLGNCGTCITNSDRNNLTGLCECDMLWRLL